MKKSLATLLLLAIAFQHNLAQAPTLGIYPSTTIASSGKNAVIKPSFAPTNTTTAVAFTSSDFKGLLEVDPFTGVVHVTNAQPAGIYEITVRAFNGTSTKSTIFTLKVNSLPVCQAAFRPGKGTVTPGSYVSAICDFDNDGTQDLVIVNLSGSVSVRFGDGLGGFYDYHGSYDFLSKGAFPSSVAVGDFNGDGSQDLVIVDYTYISIWLGSNVGFTEAFDIIQEDPSSLNTAVVGDFNGDGKQDIVVTNNDSFNIYSGNGAGQFVHTNKVNAGGNQQAIAIGDFNNDGKQDIATAIVNKKVVSINLGDGAGGFSEPSQVSIGSVASVIAIGDFNHDNKPDIATMGIGADSISIRLGDGAGGFPGILEIPAKTLAGQNNASLAIGDFNGDGNLDLAAGTYDNGIGVVSILLGDGLGGFRPASTLPRGPGSALAIGDLNGDGRQDIVVSGGENVATWLGGINEINVQGNNTNISNGDNTPDAIDQTSFGSVTDTRTDTFMIQNTGQGNLTVSKIFISGGDSSSFQILNLSTALSSGNIAGGRSVPIFIRFKPTGAGLKTTTVNVISDDCDEFAYSFTIQGVGVAVVPTLGNYPAATIDATGGNAAVLPSVAPTNTKNITAYTSPGFQGLLRVDSATGVVYITNAHPAGTYIISVKGYNGFSKTFKNFTLTVNSKSNCQVVFSDTIHVSNSTTANSTALVAIGDFNGDGNQDVASLMSPYSGASLMVRFGDGAGGFSGDDIFSSLTYFKNDAESMAVCDFNGDGKLDIITGNYFDNSVAILLGNNGVGKFTASYVKLGIYNYPSSVATGDFNQDGSQDIAVANYLTDSVFILLGDGKGGIMKTTSVIVGNGSSSLAIGDFNGDGKADFVTTDHYSNSISVRLGDGTGGFSAAANVAVGFQPVNVLIGDFNNDRKQDLAIAAGIDTISILLGDGSGGFSGTTEIRTGFAHNSIVINDFNGDGKQDIIATNNTDSTVSILLGDGGGGFGKNIDIVVGPNPVSVAIGDLNGDGKQDLALAYNVNNHNNFFSVLLGSNNVMKVLGNEVEIKDGATTSSTADSTNFGNVLTGSKLTHNFMIKNAGPGNLIINRVKMAGIDSLSFTIGGITLPVTILHGDSLNFTVSFMANSAGLKTATVNIFNNNCDEAPYDFEVQGNALPGGQALNFDGNNDFVNLGTTISPFGTGDFTIQTWFKTTVNSTVSKSLINNRVSCTDGNYWDISVKSGKLLFVIDGNNAALNYKQITSPLAYNDDQWHQVTCTRSGTLVKMYIDTGLVASGNSAGITNLNAVSITKIGSSPCGSFSGELDETRIWRRALGQCEIQIDINCEIPASANGLVANYHYNQGAAGIINQTDSMLTDASGKNNNGALTNFALSGTASNWVSPGAVVSDSSCNSNMWLGITNAWNSPGNWSTGNVPTSNTNVVVNSCAAIMPVVTGAANTCYTLTTTTGATVTIAAGARLIITGQQLR